MFIKLILLFADFGKSPAIDSIYFTHMLMAILWGPSLVLQYNCAALWMDLRGSWFASSTAYLKLVNMHSNKMWCCSLTWGDNKSYLPIQQRRVPGCLQSDVSCHGWSFHEHWTLTATLKGIFRLIFSIKSCNRYTIILNFRLRWWTEETSWEATYIVLSFMSCWITDEFEEVQTRPEEPQSIFFLTLAYLWSLIAPIAHICWRQLWTIELDTSI